MELKDIRKKDILIWGAGRQAIAFLSLNRDIQIYAFIDSKKTGSFLGKKILSPCEAANIIKRHYVIIATSDDAFWDIHNYLESEGLSEFKDYCFYSVYGKKVAVAYGNCHMIAIKNGLLQSEQFRKIYGFYPIRPICDIYNNDLDDLKSDIFKNCDLLLHQSIQNDNKYGEQFSSKNVLKNTKGKVISIPNFHHMPKCFYPQNPLTKDGHILIEGVRFRRDIVIERLHLQGLNKKEIVDYLKKGKPFNDDEILDSFSLFIDKIRARERDWDIKMSEWVLENYKEHQLFYDLGHPGNYLLEHILDGLMTILSINDKREIYLNTWLDSNEVPVYGQVRKLFNLKWGGSRYLRSHAGDPLYGRRISVDEYVNQYLYCINYLRHEGETRNEND